MAREEARGARAAVPAVETPEPAPVPTGVPRSAHAATRLTPAVMTVAEAARQLKAPGGGTVVFRQAPAAPVSVLWRAANGDLVLVETDES